MKKKLILALALSTTFLLTACTKSHNNPRDPYEKFNRTMFAFNRGFDKAVFRPAARVYTMAFPSTIRQGFGNAFNNAAEVAVLPNDILQGKVNFFFHDLVRILINTTLGIGGLFDVASHLGLKHHEQGYAATLAYYSPKGSLSPYLVLPIIGSYTFRSAVSLLAGYYSEPVSWINSISWRFSLVGMYMVSKRSDLMDANKVVDNAFDPYVLVRNAFLQRHDKRLARILSEKTLKDQKRIHDSDFTDPDIAVINDAIEQKPHDKKTKPKKKTQPG